MKITLAQVATDAAPLVMVMLQKHAAASDTDLRRYYRICLKWMVRELPLPATKASNSALTEAQRLRIPNLRNLSWAQQPAYDPGRKVLHWEHMRPVGDITDDLVALPAPTLQAVEKILRTYQVVWITKAEDSRLPKHHRADPIQDYINAEIALYDLQ